MNLEDNHLSFSALTDAINIIRNSKTVQLCGSDADAKQQIAAIVLSDLSHSTR